MPKDSEKLNQELRLKLETANHLNLGILSKAQMYHQTAAALCCKQNFCVFLVLEEIRDKYKARKETSISYIVASDYRQAKTILDDMIRPVRQHHSCIVTETELRYSLTFKDLAEEGTETNVIIINKSFENFLFKGIQVK